MSGGVWDLRLMRTAAEAAGVALWSWNVDTDKITMDDRAFDLWGLPVREGITFEELSARIHPADLDKVRAAFAATREMFGPYETDFRILHEKGDVRWVSARGRGDDQGIIGRIMFGVFLDVTVRKQAEEAREMVTGEMHHRIKNLFAVSSALTHISSRTTATKEEMTEDLMRRLASLSAAHDLIRPGFNEQKEAAPLAEVLAVLLEPYAGTGQVHTQVPNVLVGENSATAVAMIVHELATNSVKYGALSIPSGRLELRGTDANGQVSLVSTETGGPAVAVPTEKPGFGSRNGGKKCQ